MLYSSLLAGVENNSARHWGLLAIPVIVHIYAQMSMGNLSFQERYGTFNAGARLV